MQQPKAQLGVAGMKHAAHGSRRTDSVRRRSHRLMPERSAQHGVAGIRARMKKDGVH
jgi:hypothetical protein